jgi:hypothetical protein
MSVRYGLGKIGRASLAPEVRTLVYVDMDGASCYERLRNSLYPGMEASVLVYSRKPRKVTSITASRDGEFALPSTKYRTLMSDQDHQ